MDHVIDVNPAEAKAMNRRLPSGFMYVPISATMKRIAQHAPPAQHAEQAEHVQMNPAQLQSTEMQTPSSVGLDPLSLSGCEADGSTPGVPLPPLEAGTGPDPSINNTLGEGLNADLAARPQNPLLNNRELPDSVENSVSALQDPENGSPAVVGVSTAAAVQRGNNGLHQAPGLHVKGGRIDKVPRKQRSGEHRGHGPAPSSRPPGASASRSVRRPKR